ncbi:MAG: hypothetical protein AB6733_09090 [Clostridiaceae bacterium]
MKRTITSLLLILSILLTATACSIEKHNDIPDINLNFNVSNLTDEEFQYVGTEGVENATKNDFKNIEFVLHVKYSNEISKGSIIVPDIEKNLHDKGILWFGESSSQDNLSENFATYEKKYVFLSKGLDEQAIRNIFNSSEVKISWTTSGGEKKESVLNLDEIIQFK